ncbi:unnamed protein product, partial [Protopolystoma xenopodis]
AHPIHSVPSSTPSYDSGVYPEDEATSSSGHGCHMSPSVSTATSLVSTLHPNGPTVFISTLCPQPHSPSIYTSRLPPHYLSQPRPRRQLLPSPTTPVNQETQSLQTAQTAQNHPVEDVPLKPELEHIQPPSIRGLNQPRLTAPQAVDQILRQTRQSRGGRLVPKSPKQSVAPKYTLSELQTVLEPSCPPAWQTG